MKKRTETSALKDLTGDVKVVGKTIIVGAKGLNGLNACGAMDYLKNHCGYR